jgi:hypothetical protein
MIDPTTWDEHDHRCLNDEELARFDATQSGYVRTCDRAKGGSGTRKIVERRLRMKDPPRSLAQFFCCSLATDSSVSRSQGHTETSTHVRAVAT